MSKGPVRCPRCGELAELCDSEGRQWRCSNHGEYTFTFGNDSAEALAAAKALVVNEVSVLPRAEASSLTLIAYKPSVYCEEYSCGCRMQHQYHSSECCIDVNVSLDECCATITELASRELHDHEDSYRFTIVRSGHIVLDVSDVAKESTSEYDWPSERPADVQQMFDAARKAVRLLIEEREKERRQAAERAAVSESESKRAKERALLKALKAKYPEE